MKTRTIIALLVASIIMFIMDNIIYIAFGDALGLNGIRVLWAINLIPVAGMITSWVLFMKNTLK